jgi:hypothetical protein
VRGLAGSLNLNAPLPLPRLLKPLKLAVPPLVALAFAALPPWARRLYRAPGLPPPTSPPRSRSGPCVGPRHSPAWQSLRRSSGPEG